MDLYSSTSTKLANFLSFPFGAQYNSFNSYPTLNLKPKVAHNNYGSTPFYGRLIRNSSPSYRTPCLQVPTSAPNTPGSADDDRKALETVFKLYAAIKNKDIQELSDIIGDECRCVSNLTSLFQSFHGKKEVLDFFSSLMSFLGNNIEFVVQPTLHDGLSVGVSWSLECNKTRLPLGKGISFYMFHKYQGKLVIRNVEMFMEPLLHIEPFRMKVMGAFMIVLRKLRCNKIKPQNRRGLWLMLGLFVTAAMLFHLILA